MPEQPINTNQKDKGPLIVGCILGAVIGAVAYTVAFLRSHTDWGGAVGAGPGVLLIPTLGFGIMGAVMGGILGAIMVAILASVISFFRQRR